MASRKNKIAIIGPYPPPYGGISVHIRRIVTYLPDKSYVLYNIAKKSTEGIPFYGIRKYLYLISFLFKPYRIIHYHSTSTKIRFILSFIALFRKGIYLHLHGASFSDTLNRKSLTSFLFRKLIKHVNILASNDTLYEEFTRYNPLSIACIDAFLPPKFDQEEYESIINKLSLPKAKHVIFMVGWFAYYHDEDLYGYDIMLETLNLLRKRKNVDVKVMASVNGIKDQACYDHFLKRREELALSDDFVLIMDDLEEIYPLFLHSDIFVRPTNTDGNAVSIKEAMWFRCRVIASDAVVRPENTVLFQNRNAEDLSVKIKELLDAGTGEKMNSKIEEIRNSKPFQPLLTELYGLEE